MPSKRSLIACSLMSCLQLFSGEIPPPAQPPLLEEAGGAAITTAATWEKRRKELLELFQSEVYGRVPDTQWQSEFTIEQDNGNVMDGRATLKVIRIAIRTDAGNLSFRLNVFIPNNAVRPVPAFLLISLRPLPDFDPDNKEQAKFPWLTEKAIEAGYAAAIFHNAEVARDKDDSFVDGIFPLMSGGKERNNESWGAIRAWAWGASRALDYLISDKDIDGKRVAVTGHSRGGKTALVAGAFDERFALVISNNSGCTGAALSRRRMGETVKAINEAFPHWFCLNYRKFNDREDDLPIDQHQLIACIAPRAVYVTSASEDDWADPTGEFLALRDAAPVWSLYGANSPLPPLRPELDRPVWSGRLGYHIRTGKHSLSEYDWTQFLKFADNVFSSQK